MGFLDKLFGRKPASDHAHDHDHDDHGHDHPHAHEHPQDQPAGGRTVTTPPASTDPESAPGV